MLEPQKSLTLLALFAEQFETLENPWPLLDILLKKKHYFQKSQFGKDYLSILLYLVRNFSNYRKQRIELLRPLFCSFILSNNIQTAKTAYISIYSLFIQNLWIIFLLKK